MLTPAKIKNHHFEAAGRSAYKTDSVDSFFEEVSESYDQMFRENGEMFKKINLLAERLEEYRKDEDNIRAALLTAQRMSDKIKREADEKAKSVVAYATEKARLEREKAEKDSKSMVDNAKKQAQSIVDEAKAKSEKMLFDATNESEKAAKEAKEKRENEETALVAMQREVTMFKKKVMDAYSKQYSLIEQLPEIVLDKLEEAKREKETQIENEKATPVKEEPVEEPEEDASDDDITVDNLQKMMDDNLDDDSYENEEETATQIDEESAGNAEFVIPEVDEVSDEDLTNLVDSFSSGTNERREEPEKFFVKDKENKYVDDAPEEEEEVEEAEPENDDDSGNGFKVNFANIDSYNSEQMFDDDDEDELVYDDEDEEEEEDEDEDEDEDGFPSKFKGFFKK